MHKLPNRAKQNRSGGGGDWRRPTLRRGWRGRGGRAGPVRQQKENWVREDAASCNKTHNYLLRRCCPLAAAACGKRTSERRSRCSDGHTHALHGDAWTSNCLSVCSLLPVGGVSEQPASVEPRDCDVTAWRVWRVWRVWRIRSAGARRSWRERERENGGIRLFGGAGGGWGVGA